MKQNSKQNRDRRKKLRRRREMRIYATITSLLREYLRVKEVA